MQSEKVTCMCTRPFKINHVHDETKTVLLLDSNGKAFEDLDIPSDMQVFAFSGSKISDIVHILTSSESTHSQIDTVVIGIGTNNRNDLNASQAIQDMKDILHWCNQRKKRLFWLDIPQFGGVLCTKSVFRILYILKINRIMPFCNLFMGRPSYTVTSGYRC